MKPFTIAVAMIAALAFSPTSNTSRKRGNARTSKVKRICAVVAAAIAGTLLAAPAASAFTIGTGDFAPPGLAVDAAGTAYIAWNGEEQPVIGSQPRFCRLPRSATACDSAAATSIAASGTSLSRPFVTVSGDRVVVVQYRYGAGVPGFGALYAFTSTDRGVSFGPGRVVGELPFYDAVVGPNDTMSGATSGCTGCGGGFQNVPLDGSDPRVDINGISTRPWAKLSQTHFGGTVGLIDASTPLAVFSNSSAAQYRRYTGSGDLNDANSWTAAQNIDGFVAYPSLAGGPSGLFLMSGNDGNYTAQGEYGYDLVVRKWNGAGFASAVTIARGNRDGHLFQDAAGRLHAVFSRGLPADLVHAVSDDGVTWRSGKIAFQADGAIGSLRVATAPDHVGVAVWSTGIGGGVTEIRVAPLGPDVAPSPPPVVPPPVVVPRPPVIAAPVVKPKPSFAAMGLARRVGRRFRIKVNGALVLPGGVTDAKGCSGTVEVTVTRAAKLVTSKTVPVKTSCAFSFRAAVTRAKVGRSRKLAVRIRFNGNTALSAVTKVGSIRVKR